MADVPVCSREVGTRWSLGCLSTQPCYDSVNRTNSQHEKVVGMRIAGITPAKWSEARRNSSNKSRSVEEIESRKCGDMT